VQVARRRIELIGVHPVGHQNGGRIVETIAGQVLQPTGNDDLAQRHAPGGIHRLRIG
jgi:hypothetical protein